MRAGSFARAAAAQIVAPEWRGISVSLFLLLTVTNALLALHAPAPGAAPSPAFTSAGAVRAIGLFSISVALLRAATGSERKRWSTDGGFWLFLALSLVELGLEAGATWLTPGLDVSARILIAEALALLVSAPLAAWMVAAAVEKPLAIQPGPWFSRLGEWLPPLLTLLLPMVLIAFVHAFLSLQLIRLAGSGSFWPLALADGILSTSFVLATLALRLTAYRAVARS
jgi:hypothetical protein